MGWKWEVSAWEEEDGGYRYNAAYEGDSAFMAILVAIRLKRNGCGCVKVEWR